MSDARRTTCTHHAGCCGRHFHSLEAVDAHRTGSYSEPIGSELGRRCRSPLDLRDAGGALRPEILSESGDCRISGANADGTPRAGTHIRIWTAAGLTARRKALSELGANALRPSDARGREG
jgi:hypothetical protein